MYRVGTYRGRPNIFMDELGVGLFSNTPSIYIYIYDLKFNWILIFAPNNSLATKIRNFNRHMTKN